jgi:hypothetical protein
MIPTQDAEQSNGGGQTGGPAPIRPLWFLGYQAGSALPPQQIMGGESLRVFPQRASSQPDILGGQGVEITYNMGQRYRRCQNSLVGSGVSNAPSATTIAIASPDFLKRASASFCSLRMKAYSLSRPATTFSQPFWSR